jgi:sugar/nucleoside kinase (ribokinase family)
MERHFFPETITETALGRPSNTHFPMSLLVVGTMAFDTIETPFGKAERIIGGAATYICWAASQFARELHAVSVIGEDFPESELEALRARGVRTEGVQRLHGQKSFFWEGRYHDDLNSRDTLVTELNVLADFDPVLPEAARHCDFVMLGNLTPAVQRRVLEQMAARPKLVALDTMNFWMDVALGELLEVLRMIDVLTINDEEARQLSGERSLAKAAKKILTMGPKFLVIKKGEHGALLFHREGTFFAPALPLEEVFDPTGAGDSFAGGFMGYIAHTGDTSYEGMKKAIIYGSATASFCVEQFGIEKIKSVQPDQMAGRVAEFEKLTRWG